MADNASRLHAALGLSAAAGIAGAEPARSMAADPQVQARVLAGAAAFERAHFSASAFRRRACCIEHADTQLAATR
ncbi:MAG: hypothetical protein Q7N95_11890 [Alphaproteobacteria bacterium]|nr:hypothetical protein [Alphaproteobacteria bacterium]MDP3086079.1 hypothetical protein [Rubrivivax sp.]